MTLFPPESDGHVTPELHEPAENPQVTGLCQLPEVVLVQQVDAAAGLKAAIRAVDAVVPENIHVGFREVALV
jgi:hypothetical protein